MEIKFYNVSDEKKKIGKSLGSAILTLDGVLLTGSSVLNPKVRVSLTAAQLKSVNYAYISAFSRYYYVTNKEFIGQNVWNITFKVDALKSFETGILASNAYINRTSNSTYYNKLLTDHRFLASPVPFIAERTGTLLSSDDWKDSTWAFYSNEQDPNKMHYIVAFRANGGAPTDSSGFTLSTLTGTYYIEATPAEVFSIWGALASTIIDVSKYVIDVYWLPFALAYSASDTTVRRLNFGNILTGQNVVNGDFSFGAELNFGGDRFLMKEKEHTTDFSINLPGATIWHSDEYHGYSPYTKMTVKFLPFGTFELDTGFLAGETSVKIRVVTNTITGTAALYYYKGSITTPSSNDLRFLAMSNVKVSVPVSAESGSGLLKIVTNAFAGLRGGAGMGAAAGPYGAIIGGIAGAGSSVALDSFQFANNAPVSVSGSVNIIDSVPVLQCTIYTPDISPNLVSINGRICNQVLPLSSFTSGDYVETGEVHLVTSGMYSEEIDEVEQWLRGGVYI